MSLNRKAQEDFLEIYSLFIGNILIFAKGVVYGL